MMKGWPTYSAATALAKLWRVMCLPVTVWRMWREGAFVDDDETEKER